MAQSNKVLQLKELRFWDPRGFSSQAVSNRLKILMDRISIFYLKNLERPLELTNTNVILFSVLNNDYKLPDKDNEIFYSLGDVETFIGGSRIFVSESKLLSIDDQEKRKYLLGLIGERLIQYALQTNHNSNDLQTTYNKLITTDFFDRYKKDYKSDNAGITCWIENRVSWGCADYRLRVKHNETGKVSIYEIGRKDYPFFDEMPGLTQENMWETVLNTPQIFNPIKWEGKNFVMYWGKEKYVFDLEKDKLTREE